MSRYLIRKRHSIHVLYICRSSDLFGWSAVERRREGIVFKIMFFSWWLILLFCINRIIYLFKQWLEELPNSFFCCFFLANFAHNQEQWSENPSTLFKWPTLHHTPSAITHSSFHRAWRAWPNVLRKDNQFHKGTLRFLPAKLISLEESCQYVSWNHAH